MRYFLTGSIRNLYRSKPVSIYSSKSVLAFDVLTGDERRF